MKFKLNQTKTDYALLIIGLPFIACFMINMSLIFLIFLSFRLFSFGYAILAMPFLAFLEKLSAGQYKRAKLPEIWHKCFANFIDDWLEILNTATS